MKMKYKGSKQLYGLYGDTFRESDRYCLKITIECNDARVFSSVDEQVALMMQTLEDQSEKLREDFKNG